MIPPDPDELLPDGPHSSGPERKHGSGLAEGREPPFIYGHVWVWDTRMERQIEEGQKREKLDEAVWTAHLQQLAFKKQRHAKATS